MRAHLLELWHRRTAGERRIGKVAGAVLAAALVVWLVHTASDARSRLRASVTALKADAMRLERDAAEITQLRAVQSPSLSQTDVRTVFQLQSSAAGLSGSVVRLDASGRDQVTVGLGAVAFVDWLSLLQRLQVHRVRLESSRIEALSAPGMIGVTATFTRAPSQ